jgi:hypothetical protein
MSDFERTLGRELDRLDAPEGFAERVMERVARRERERRRQVQAWRMSIAAGLLVCLSTAGYEVEKRREAEAAREQFAIAMRVTGRSLEAVDRGLNRVYSNTQLKNGGTR